MSSWVSLFSQTGSEIVSLAKALNRWPDKIITNQKDLSKLVDFQGHEVIQISENTEEVFEDLFKESVFITLHGYLRILPAVTCEHYEVFNGHPALITKYPELKGFNKQEEAFIFKEKYPLIGTVIHKVIPEVDCGEIILSNEAPNTVASIDDAYSQLKRMSLDLWKRFFLEEYYLC